MKIALITAGNSPYDSMACFTHELSQAFQRLGIESKMIYLDQDDIRTSFQSLLSFGPDCLLIMSAIQFGGKPICDALEIPTFFYMVDPPRYALGFVHSPYCRMGFIDKKHVDQYEATTKKKALFLPHAIDPIEAQKPVEKPQYETVFFGSFLDCDQFEKNLADALGKKKAGELIEAVIALAEREMTVDDLVAHLNLDDAKHRFWLNLDHYFRGYVRLKFLQSIKKHQVHVYGSTLTSKSWKDVTSQANIRVEKPVHYEELKKIMRRSEVVLSCSPQYREGIHERYVLASAMKKPLVASLSHYGKEQFKDSVSFFTMSDLDSIDDVIEQAKKNNTSFAQEITLQNHTWDNRAKEIDAFLRSEIGI